MISFLGGTGPEGRGLALRLAAAGEGVFIGSRSRERGKETARALQALLPQAYIQGGSNQEAAEKGDLVFLSVPYEGQRPLLSLLHPLLQGKVVVSTVAPLTFSQGRVRALSVPQGSAAQQAQSLLPGSRVVAAFHHLSAEDLLHLDKDLEADVIVCADDARARNEVMTLVAKIPGLRAINGGPLENAHYLEEFTALLLQINRIYGCRSSIKIVGL